MRTVKNAIKSLEEKGHLIIERIITENNVFKYTKYKVSENIKKYYTCFENKEQDLENNQENTCKTKQYNENSSPMSEKFSPIKNNNKDNNKYNKKEIYKEKNIIKKEIDKKESIVVDDKQKDFKKRIEDYFGYTNSADNDEKFAETIENVFSIKKGYSLDKKLNWKLTSLSERSKKKILNYISP